MHDLLIYESEGRKHPQNVRKNPQRHSITCRLGHT